VFAYAQNITMYVGTYKGKDSQWVYIYNFNTKTGELPFLNSIKVPTPFCLLF